MCFFVTKADNPIRSDLEYIRKPIYNSKLAVSFFFFKIVLEFVVLTVAYVLYNWVIYFDSF